MSEFQVHSLAMARVPRDVMQRNSKVATLTVEKTVLAEAIRAANGDPGRLEIISPNEIVVWNSRYQRDVLRLRRGNRRHKLMLNSTYGKDAS